MHHVQFGAGDLAFQIGEAAQIHSGGVLQVTVSTLVTQYHGKYRLALGRRAAGMQYVQQERSAVSIVSTVYVITLTVILLCLLGDASRGARLCGGGRGGWRGCGACIARVVRFVES